MKEPPPPGPAKGVHFVDLRIVTIGDMKLIVGSVRLFAHSGTAKHGMPIYRVVVGAPRAITQTLEREGLISAP
jgi:hypothetical protein